MSNVRSNDLRPERGPSVSVIVTVFRRVEYLAAALQSVLVQTQLPFEIIVSDDGDEDRIRDLLLGLPGNQLIQYRSNPEPLGAAGNVQAALSQCRGDLIAILNDDDLWEPDLLARLAGVFEHHPEVVLAFSDHWIIDAPGQVDRQSSEMFSSRYGRDRLAEGILVDPAEVAVLGRSVPVAICALVRREIAVAHPIPGDVRGAYDFWIAVASAASGRPFYYVRERLARYRLHPMMESRRSSPDGSEGHRAVVDEIYRRGWFPHLRRQLRRRRAGVYCDCGLERLAHGDSRVARHMLINSLRSEISWRALAALVLAGSAGPGRLALRLWRAPQRGTNSRQHDQ